VITVHILHRDSFGGLFFYLKTMKSFKEFREAYSQAERKSHTPVPKLPVDRKLRIDYGDGKKKYNMPMPSGQFVPPKTTNV